MRLPVILVVSLLIATAAGAQARQEVNLGGQWEFVKVADLAAGPPAEGWQPMAIPGVLGGYDYERAWFRRDFAIPETMLGQRLVLHFGGVKWNSVVRVNGQQVGGHFGGYEPFDVDITAVGKVGEANRLELGCCDWTGVFVDRETDFSVMKQRPMDSRDLPRDKILAPIGGLTTQYGVWDEVSLRSHPAVYVKDLFIQPSVRDKKLRVEYVLANEGAEAVTERLSPVVEDRGKAALSLPRQTVTVPAGGEAKVTTEVAWPRPRLWSPADPYLYFLVTRLEQGGAPVDELRTRFGFREFWVQGPRFYLNGARINLLATSWWPELFQTKEYIRERMRGIKAGNCVVFRTHTQPWPEVWYETADEEGLMMIPEGAVWNDDEAYRVDDPRFWNNYAAHLQAMVDRDKNKPSVVMYSLENEFYGGRLNNQSASRQDLARMGRLVKQWDPTRPIMYESDGDPEGVADVVGIHYPHEYPEYTQWPNTAYWMDQPLKASYFFVPQPERSTDWLWDRKKPVYMGEFLWVPSSDPSWHTVFYGDDAYLDYDLYRVKAKGESWKMAIQAYRYYEIGGISPWTMVEGGGLDEARNPMYEAQKYAMQPIAAYVREYDHSFYGGTTVRRTADVYNDVLETSNLTVRWALRDGDKALEQGSKALKLGPGERQELKFAVKLPAVQARRELELRLRIERGDKEVFVDRKPLSVFPAVTLQAPEGLGLYDPDGRTAAALARLGVRATPVADLGAIPAPVRTLIVGAGSLKAEAAQVPVIGGQPRGAEGLLRYARDGGRVLVLEQQQYPVGTMPVALTTQASTMTFPQMPGHPLLRGVTAGDLKWWAPDNFVTTAEPPRPLQGGFRAVVVSGSSQGLACAPLLELPLGKGTLVMSQLRLLERLAVEPMAGVILQNALDYLAAYQVAAARTALYCPDPRTREYLGGLGLSATDITADPAAANWDETDLLVACGPLAGLVGVIPQVAALVERGGTALLHRVSPEEMTLLVPLLGPGLDLVPYHGSVTRLPGTDALAESLANEDLYWLGVNRAANSWATTPRAEDMTEAVFAKSLAGKQVTEHGHERMTVSGPYTSNDGEAASLPSGGSTATLEIEVAKAGAYILGVVAGGSPAGGQWPAGSVAVDGRVFGTFACRRGEPDTYTVSGDLAAGKHEVVIRFTNDFYDEANRQDRNMVVRSLLVAEDEKLDGVTFLTSPPAVAVVRRGQGRVVVDNVNWDTTDRNTDKASRYASGLLVGLGARFEVAGGGTIIELMAFEPQPGLTWFRREATGVYMGASGYIAGPVDCARAGRYVLRIAAKGTPAGGIHPIIALEVDQQRVGLVELNTDGWRTYPLPVDLAEGRHELRIVFTNDQVIGGEDRNLWLGRVEVVAAP